MAHLEVPEMRPTAAPEHLSQSLEPGLSTYSASYKRPSLAFHRVYQRPIFRTFAPLPSRISFKVNPRPQTLQRQPEEETGAIPGFWMLGHLVRTNSVLHSGHCL